MKRGRALGAYGLAVALVVAGALLRETLDPLWGLKAPFLMFYPAIALAAWWEGLGPGLVATLSGALVSTYLWLPPVHSFAMKSRSDLVELSLFVAIGVLISVLNERLHASRRALTAAVERESAARAEADLGNLAREQFLAWVSHELRTPLQSTLAWLRVLRGDPAEPNVLKAVVTIERAVRQQARLIDDLLDMSRIIAGKIRLNVSEVALARILRDVVDAIQPIAREKGVDLGAVIVAPSATVRGDPERLHQVFTNLVTNAVKFTSAGGRVVARLDEVAGEASVSIVDTGVGISPALLPHVFEWFWQGTAGDRHGDRSLGLGLGIARELIELHGGVIDAVSEGEGKGATFRVRLPLVALRCAVP